MANIIDSFLILFNTQVRGNGIQQVNKQIASTTKNMMGANNMLKMFFGYDLYRFVRQLVPDLIATSQQLGAMESRFNAVSTSARAGAEELKWVGDQSKRLGLNFLRTADDYSIFYATVSKNMGQGTTRKVFEQWAEAFRVLHIDPERQSRVLYALREMSSKGKIYMQDLALQLGSAVPDAMNLAATSMGYVGPKAVERFRKAIKDGAIDVKKFIPMFSEAVNKQYVSSQALSYAMSKPDAQIQLLTTHWQMFQMAISKGGFEKDLVKTLKSVNFLLGGLEKHGATIYKSLKLIAGILAVSGGLKLIGWLGQALSIVTRMSAIIGAGKIMRLIPILMKALPILAPLIGLLTTPVGLGIAIVAGLIFAGKWVLDKFFPNVSKALGNIWDGLVLRIEAWWIGFSNELRNSPIGKWFDEQNKKNAPKNKTNQIGGGLYNNVNGHPMMFGVELVGLRQMMGHEKLTRGNPTKPINFNTTNTIKPNINITVQTTGDTPQEMIQAIQDGTLKATNAVTKKIWEAINHSNINSRPSKSNYSNILPLATKF